MEYLVSLQIVYAYTAYTDTKHTLHIIIKRKLAIKKANINLNPN